MAGLTEIEKVVIEQRCARLVHQFALYNDASDYEPMVAMFTEDAVFGRPTQPDQPMVGRATILEQFKKRPARTLCHLMVNVVITPESATTATGECYVLLYSGPPREPGVNDPAKADANAMMGGFKDRFVKVGDEWLFAERRGFLTLATAPG